LRPRRARQHQAGEFVTAAQLKKHFYRPDVISSYRPWQNVA
jgi:hypothetical protein